MTMQALLILASLVLVVLVVLVALIVSKAVRRGPEARSAPGTLPEGIADFAALCAHAYDFPRATGFDVGPWALLAIEDKGAIWLWAHRDTPTSYAVVLRGTADLADLGACVRLAQASLFRSVDHWAGRADALFRRVKTALAIHGIDPSTHHLTCAGHSLGASYAEHVLHCLRSKRGDDGPLHAAVTFDSPGHPFEFRRQRGMPDTLAGLTSVMPPSNVINTLDVPLAERLYSCGRGSRVSLAAVVDLGWSICVRGPRALVTLCCDRAAALEQHCMRWIIEALAAGDFAASSRERWEQSMRSAYVTRPAAAAASAISSICLATGFALAALTSTAAQAAWLEAEPDALEPDAGLPEVPRLPPLPDTREAMLLKQAYYSANMASAWSAFCLLLRPRDRVVLLVKATSQGKTCVFRALLGTPLDDTTLVVAPGVNTTCARILARVTSAGEGEHKYSTYLVDLPGLGAAQQAHGETGLTNAPDELLQTLAVAAGHILFVRKEPAMQDAEVECFDKLAQFAKARRMQVTAVFNHPNFVTERDFEKARTELARPLALSPDAIVTCSVNTGAGWTLDDQRRSGYDNTALLQLWHRIVTAPESDNGYASVGRRAQLRQSCFARHFQRHGGAYGAAVGSYIAAVSLGVCMGPGLAAGLAFKYVVPAVLIERWRRPNEKEAPDRAGAVRQPARAAAPSAAT